MTKGLLKLSGALTITALCLSACDKPAATTTDATAEPAKESTPTISANDKPAEQGAAQRHATTRLSSPGGRTYRACRVSSHCGDQPCASARRRKEACAHR